MIAALKRFLAMSMVATGAFISVGTVSVLAQATPVQAPTTTTTTPLTSSIADNVCRGVLSADSGSVPQNTTVQNCQESGDASFSFLIKRIINIFSVVVGAVSVIMIIIGGFRYIISGGDSSGVSGAKNTILYAIVGLVIVLFAQVIVRFILANAIAAT